MDDAQCVFMFFIGLIFILGIISYGQSISNKETIKQEVHRHGGRIVKISYRWFGGDRANYSYNVVFTDQFGKEYQTSCQKSRSLWAKQLYWTQTPRELLYETQLNSNRQIPITLAGNEPLGNEGVESNNKSSKELIIDDLYQENLRLKRELEQLRKNNNMDEV